MRYADPLTLHVVYVNPVAILLARERVCARPSKEPANRQEKSGGRRFLRKTMLASGRLCDRSSQTQQQLHE